MAAKTLFAAMCRSKARTKTTKLYTRNPWTHSRWNSSKRKATNLTCVKHAIPRGLLRRVIYFRFFCGQCFWVILDCSAGCVHLSPKLLPPVGFQYFVCHHLHRLAALRGHLPQPMAREFADTHCCRLFRWYCRAHCLQPSAFSTQCDI